MTRPQYYLGELSPGPALDRCSQALDHCSTKGCSMASANTAMQDCRLASLYVCVLYFSYTILHNVCRVYLIHTAHVASLALRLAFGIPND